MLVVDHALQRTGLGKLPDGQLENHRAGAQIALQLAGEIPDRLPLRRDGVAVFFMTQTRGLLPPAEGRETGGGGQGHPPGS